MNNRNTTTTLVTGGAGFVGSAVLRALLARDDERQIVVVDNLFNGQKQFLPESERVSLRELDLRDTAGLADVVQQVRPSVVIHLAALHFIPYCNAHPSETMEVNVVGTQNLLDACVTCPPLRLVAASSAAVYPIYEMANREDHPLPRPTDIYGLSKWVNEQQLELYSQQVGTKCAAARLFNVYGPRETNPHVLPEIIEQTMAGKTHLALGNVKPKRDYVYVNDVARAIVALAERSEQSYRAYNVGTGDEYSVEELVERLSDICGRQLSIDTDPNRVRKSDRMHLVCDRSRIQKEIGWTPIYDLTSGLRELWHYSVHGVDGVAKSCCSPAVGAMT